MRSRPVASSVSRDARPFAAPALRWLAQVVVGVGLALVAGVISAQPSPSPSSGDAAPSPSSEPEEPRSEPARPRLDEPVVAYRLKATLDVLEHRVTGRGTITWRNASSKDQREVWLHLYLNAFKNQRTAFMRSTATRGSWGGGTPKTWGWVRVDSFKGQGADLWAGAAAHTPDDPDDETDIRVPLVEPVAPGDEVTFEMSWTAQLPEVTARTGFSDSFHMVGQWFPKLAKLEPDGAWVHFPLHRLSEFYADFGSYDVTIDVPRGFVVGASGPRVEESDGGDRHVVRHRIDRVHDFAFCAWDRFEVHAREAPTGVAMRALVPRGDADLAEIELDLAGFGLEFFGAWFGPYPYEVLTIVHPPRKAHQAGGMEYPTLITTGGRWYRPGLGMRNLESVTLHELGHQWFYGLLASNEYRWPVLDEGMTTWATLLALESRHPGRSAFAGGWLGWTISYPAVIRADAAISAGDDVIAQAADEFALGGDYGRLVYSRTATLLETLRRLYPDTMPRAIEAYATEHRFGHPEPDDLLRSVREHVGEPAATAMREVLFERGTIDVSVASMWSDEAKPAKGVFGVPGDGDREGASEGPAAEAAHVGAIVLRRRGSVELPVEVEIRGAEGKVERRIWDGRGATITWPYAGDQALESVIVDPENALLLDDDLHNNVARRDPSTVAARIWSHGSFLAAVLMGVAVP